MPWDKRPDELPLDVEECRTALWKAQGNITEAAAILKITSMRLRRFVDSSPRLSAELKESKEQLKDIAEANLVEALTDPDDTARRDSMTKFVLTNLGGDRGYGQKNGSGLTIKAGGGSGSFTVSWEDGSSFNEPDDGKTIEHG